MRWRSTLIHKYSANVSRFVVLMYKTLYAKLSFICLNVCEIFWKWRHTLLWTSSSYLAAGCICREAVSSEISWLKISRSTGCSPALWISDGLRKEYAIRDLQFVPLIYRFSRVWWFWQILFYPIWPRVHMIFSWNTVYRGVRLFYLHVAPNLTMHILLQRAQFVFVKTLLPNSQSFICAYCTGTLPF